MTDEAKALVDVSDHARSDLTYIMGLIRHIENGGDASKKNVSDLIAMVRWNAERHLECRDLIETQAHEIERLREACEKVKKSAVATAKIRLVKREREMEVCRSNMSRAKMKCRANEASILLGELRALDVAAIIGDSHD